MPDPGAVLSLTRRGDMYELHTSSRFDARRSYHAPNDPRSAWSPQDLGVWVERINQMVRDLTDRHEGA